MMVKLNYKGVTVQGTPEGIVEMMARWGWDGYPTNEEYRAKVLNRLNQLYGDVPHVDNDADFLAVLDSLQEVEIL